MSDHSCLGQRPLHARGPAEKSESASESLDVHLQLLQSAFNKCQPTMPGRSELMDAVCDALTAPEFNIIALFRVLGFFWGSIYTHAFYDLSENPSRPATPRRPHKSHVEPPSERLPSGMLRAMIFDKSVGLGKPLKTV